MKKILVAVFALLVAVSGAAIAGDKNGPKEVDAKELSQWLTKGEIILVDSRGGKYFDGEMIKGAINLPADKTDEDSLTKIAPSKEDAKLVFYCTNTACNASALAGYKAIAAGYKNVFKYPGGIEDWKEKGLPVENKS